MKALTMIRVLILAPLLVQPVGSASPQRVYEIWENEPAPNRGPDLEKPSVGNGTPFDKDWEQWSHPIGNGYMGANLFGRVDTERIQITEKTLHNKGIYGGGGLTSFAEVYLDFSHEDVRNYRRSLNLNDAIAYVSYEHGGVKYTREYFMSYPDNVMVVRLGTDKNDALSFVLRPEIPYLNKEDKRTGKVTADKDLVTLSGMLPFFNINYEGQVKDSNRKIIKTASDRKGRIKFASTKGETYTFAF